MKKFFQPCYSNSTSQVCPGQVLDGPRVGPGRAPSGPQNKKIFNIGCKLKISKNLGWVIDLSPFSFVYSFSTSNITKQSTDEEIMRVMLYFVALIQNLNEFTIFCGMAMEVIEETHKNMLHHSIK